MVAEGVGGAAELRAWLQAAEARKVAGKGFFEETEETPEAAAQEEAVPANSCRLLSVSRGRFRAPALRLGKCRELGITYLRLGVGDEALLAGLKWLF